MEGDSGAISLIGIVCGIIFGFPLSLLICFFKMVFISPFLHFKILKNAEKKGHVVKAVLEKTSDGVNKNGFKDSSRQIGLYTYEYNNKKYKIRLGSVMELPKEITLYFNKNPKRAVVKSEVGFYDNPLFLYYLISVFIISVISTYLLACEFFIK